MRCMLKGQSGASSALVKKHSQVNESLCFVTTCPIHPLSWRFLAVSRREVCRNRGRRASKFECFSSCEKWLYKPGASAWLWRERKGLEFPLVASVMLNSALDVRSSLTHVDFTIVFLLYHLEFWFHRLKHGYFGFAHLHSPFCDTQHSQ